jgi:hypothetical protein
MNEPITLPPSETPEGFEAVAAIRMPCPLNGFSKFCRLSAMTWGKESRLLTVGKWAFIIAPIPAENQTSPAPKS